MDQQRFMDILARYGSSVLEAIVGNNSNYEDFNFSSEDDTEEQALFDFIKMKYNEIGKPNGTNVLKSNCFLKPDPLIPMPPELYRRRIDQIKRRRLFFKQLQRRDILYLQVINTKIADSYKCLVLAKHGDLAQLGDLSLVMYFPKLRPELESLKGGHLNNFDLLRGAFWSCSAIERKFFVTLDTSIFTEEEMEKVPKLGQISQIDLPYYVRCKKVGMTYAGYIQRSAGYKEDGYCMKQLHDCLGLDTNRIHSFFTEWNGINYPVSETFVEVKKKLIPDDSTKSLLKSFEYFRDGNMYKALYYANKAIAFNPDNIQARVTRGTVYANLGKIRKALVDTLDCLKLDSKHEAACKQMAELLVAASKSLLRKKNYIKWYEFLVMAKNYNPKNREVQELLSCSRFETSPNGVSIPIQPSFGKVIAIYARLFNEEDKRRRVKQFRKIRKRKRKQHRRRRRAARQKAKRAMVAQPIPTPTFTARREVFLRPSSPVFRRPFPPRS